MNIFDKISSYDLITSLIPGAFLVEAFRASGVPFIDASHLATWILLAYALGLLCNRLGSLIVEPQIQKLTKREHSYTQYVEATKEDERLEALVEKATFYRTMLTAAMVYLLGVAVFLLFGEFLKKPTYSVPVAAFGAIGLFYLSYAKQERYIARRVQKVIDGDR